VALRVNPDVDPKSHPHISTGLKRNKFGVAFDTVPSVCREALGWTGVEVVGLHVHIGSQILEIEPLRRAVAALVGLAETLRAQGTALSHLDVGGGLGIAYDGAVEPSYEAYAAMVIAAVRPLGLGLVLEPGRTLVAPTGALLTRVVDVKTQADGRLVVVVDASMTELIRPALYGAFHRIESVVQDAARASVTCDIVGPVCESSDSFGTDRVLPSPQVGDLLAIRDAGAYGAVMASNYNRRPLPPEVVVEGAGWRVARRRQTVDDMLAWEN
jgi:diaminopimelate decarboxylase